MATDFKFISLCHYNNSLRETFCGAKVTRIRPVRIFLHDDAKRKSRELDSKTVRLFWKVPFPETRPWS